MTAGPTSKAGAPDMDDADPKWKRFEKLAYEIQKEFAEMEPSL